MEQQKNDALAIWTNTDEIKTIFAPTLTPTEFKFFMGLGQRLGANPFTREIWAIKFGTAAATIFLGRDFYRKKAQEQPDYDGCYTQAVYSNDVFSMKNGVVSHEFTLTDRGSLLSAYAVVKRKNISQDFFVMVQLSEYDLKQSNWKTKPETMLKKVAESQALRGAFQGVFEGTYDESEERQQASPETGTLMIIDQQKETIQSLVVNEVISEKERAPILNKIDGFTFDQAVKCVTWLTDEIKFREEALEQQVKGAQE